MTAEEDKAANIILALGGITENEAKCAVSFINQILIDGERRECKIKCVSKAEGMKSR